MWKKTPLQDQIVKVYQELSKTQTVYPTYKVLAKKAKVSVKYAHYVITQWKLQNKLFGIKNKQ